MPGFIRMLKPVSYRLICCVLTLSCMLVSMTSSRSFSAALVSSSAATHNDVQVCLVVVLPQLRGCLGQAQNPMLHIAFGTNDGTRALHMCLTNLPYLLSASTALSSCKPTVHSLARIGRHGRREAGLPVAKR